MADVKGGVEINLGNVLQGLILAALIWQVSTLQEISVAVKLHEYRIAQMEKNIHNSSTQDVIDGHTRSQVVR